MKSKTLITMAVASTFGWSASVFAGPSPEVATPFSVSESGQNIVSQHQGYRSDSFSTAMTSSDSLVETTGHDLELSDASDWSASFDQMAEADIYDVYLVSFAPMDSWDYYVIDVDSGDTVALIDDQSYYLVPVEYIAFFSDDSQQLSEEAPIL